MPGIVELILAGLIVIAYPMWVTFSGWPQMLRLIHSGRPNGRVLVYVEIIVVEWILAAVIAAVWIRNARPWHLLGLVPPLGWRIVLTMGLGAALIVLYRGQLRAVRRLDPAKRERVRKREGSAIPLIPHNSVERAWFVLVSLTAGFCEELMFRGFLVWAFQPCLGLWGAALASTVSFGCAHAYQGRAGALRAGIGGAAFAIVAIVTGSVVPSMILHALLDLIGGEVSYALFAEGPTRSAVA